MVSAQLIDVTAPALSHGLDTLTKGVDMLPFTYPEIKKSGTDWYVWFRAIDPARGGKLFRKRYRVNHVKTVSNREKTAKLLARKLTEKLEEGWNPFLEPQGDGLQYINIMTAMDEVLKLKQSFVRPATYHSYTIRVGMFKQWLAEAALSKHYVFEFRRDDAQKFMDWLLTTRHIGKRTYNNYRLDMATFFNQMVKRNYTTINPFGGIPRLHTDEKRRNSFTKAELHTLRKYLVKNDFDFYIVFQYTYLCGLRNSEIARLRVADVDLQRGCIHVSGDVSKTHRQDTINIMSANFLNVLRKYLKPFPLDYYLVGTDAGDRARNSAHYKPGPVARTGHSIGSRFSRIAETLGFRAGLSFYSAKDTLAGELIDLDEEITVIQKFLRHKNLMSTQAYIAKRTPLVSEKAKGMRF